MDHGYVHEIDEFEFIERRYRCHAPAKRDGLCAGGCHQPVCIARGKFTEAQFETLTEWMDWSLADRGVDLDGIYCPHHPQGNGRKEYRQTCDCRKPHPGCLSRRRNFCILIWPLLIWWAIKWKDMQAATAAGVGTKVIVRTGKPVTPRS
ncbi:D-glycero-beta-D-manno-heptose-1,7-bisphosphate 7-phosphatase [Enterobacter cloacae subsp. cloacae]|nr:D-glycero-beta-D-manno-heptose-1,7-bisphosphate 7-phosphatase [Enterobacter cloacae subsp. cloacae]